METLLQLSEAAEKFQILPSELHNRIESGKIHCAMYNGMTLVSERDLMADFPKSERPEYQKYAHLKGVGIGMRAAGRKYGVSNVTILGWVRKGLIAIVGKVGKQKILIDEADIAYCAEIHQQNPGQGKWLFNPDGTPHQKQA